MNTETTFGVAPLTVIVLMVALWMYLRKVAPKTTTLLFLIAGFGIGGLIGALIDRAVVAALNALSSPAARLFGVGVSTIIAAAAIVATLELVIKGLHKKKAKPTRWHPWLALTLPTIIAASSVPLLTELMALFSETATEIGTSVTDGIEG